MNDHIAILDETSPSVQTHLNIMQRVIERMASNSSFSKAWCITIVSAILVVVADKTKPDYALIAILPTILFLALDTYYLALEKSFRKGYSSFVTKVHSGTLGPVDLYEIKSEGNLNKLELESIKSFSIWGFYGVITLLIILARIFLMG